MAGQYTLIYSHDPMCSWCWGFRPAFGQLRSALSSAVSVQRLLGGLAADSDLAMPQAMQVKLQATWRRIQQQVPGTRFNFAFWHDCSPRRSTYPACRAVIAARELDPACEEDMILAIQQAYYLQARNPSDTQVLVELAGQIGLQQGRFRQQLLSDHTNQLLLTEISQSRRLRLNSFPGLLLLDRNGSKWRIPIDYNNADTMIERVESLIA